MLTADGTVCVDNTTLRAVAMCEAYATLRHVRGYAVPGEEHAALECGTATHEALADYLRGVDAERCLRKYELLYRGYSEDQGLDDPAHPFHRLSWANTHRILEHWFADHPLAAFSFAVNPKLVEVGFAVPLSDECVCGHPQSAHGGRKCYWWHPEKLVVCECSTYRPAFVFWGRLDAVVQGRHDGALYVLDHKTTGRLTPTWSEKFRNDSQMSGYVWAAQQTLGMPVVGVYINAIEYSQLPSAPRKCRTHGVEYAECGPLHARSELLIYTRSPEQLETWRQNAVALARTYRTLLYRFGDAPLAEALTKPLMTGTFTNACSWCDFAKFCSAGRPQHYVDSMLIRSPWQPYPLPPAPTPEGRNRGTT